ncbi:MAG TPA: hypothetical protein VN733_07515 [Solirubrobacterales bacterium]|nr:hypothetical protein [Solirubrobacterales bacterium]
MVVAGLLLLAGCGGGDEETATVSITKAQFLERANAICAKSDDAINIQFEEFSRKHFKGGHVPSSARQARAGQEIVLPVMEAQLKKLKALGVPPGEEEKLERLFDAYEEGIRRGAADPMLMLGTIGEYAFTNAYEIAGAYGLPRCVTG